PRRAGAGSRRLMELDAGNVIAMVALAWSAGATLAAGWLARQRATRQDLAELDKRVGDLESAHLHAPSARMVHDLEVAITRLSGDLKATAEKLDGVGGWLKRVDGVTQRIEQHLLDAGAERGR